MQSFTFLCEGFFITFEKQNAAMQKYNLEKLQEQAKNRYRFKPDIMMSKEEAESKKVVPPVVQKKVIKIEFPVEENPFKKQKRQDRDDVALQVLKKRTDHSERSDDFYAKRPPPNYSNTTPFGIAAQMLQEQLNEENSFRKARVRRF